MKEERENWHYDSSLFIDEFVPGNVGFPIYITRIMEKLREVRTGSGSRFPLTVGGRSQKLPPIPVSPSRCPYDARMPRSRPFCDRGEYDPGVYLL